MLYVYSLLSLPPHCCVNSGPTRTCFGEDPNSRNLLSESQCLSGDSPFLFGTLLIQGFACPGSGSRYQRQCLLKHISGLRDLIRRDRQRRLQAHNIAKNPTDTDQYTLFKA